MGEGRRGGQAQLQQGKVTSGQPNTVCPDVASAAGGSTDKDGGDCHHHHRHHRSEH